MVERIRSVEIKIEIDTNKQTVHMTCYSLAELITWLREGTLTKDLLDEALPDGAWHPANGGTPRVHRPTTRRVQP